MTPPVSPDAADGDQTFLRAVRHALCGRGLIAAHHHRRAHRVQAGDPESQGATLQVLAAHESGNAVCPPTITKTSREGGQCDG